MATATLAETCLFLGTNDDNMVDKVAKGRQFRGGGAYNNT